MDKQEYKLKADEIKSLIAKRDFFTAVKIADEIDWKRVRSVAMLCTVSDLYKVNRRYKESKELLLMAYERNPNGRMIVYSLCELCIKMGEVVQAIEYYKEFVQLAPMDNGKYVLQYKLYVAQDVSLEERIAVLEELKKRDYREKWGYELAYLYHRIGLSTRCVEECDELILWFSDGRYVKKAMELKMLHQPLTPAQEASYNSFVGKNAELPKTEPEEEKPIEEQIKVQPMKVGQYDTINLQKALAESMKEVLSPVVSDPVKEETEKPEGMGEVTGQIMAPMFRNTENMKEIFFEDKTGEMPSAPVQIRTEETNLPIRGVSEQEAVVPVMAKANLVVNEEVVVKEAVADIPREIYVEEVSQEEVKEEPAEEVVEEIPQEEVKEEPAEEVVEEVPQEEVKEEPKEEPTEEIVEEVPQEEVKEEPTEKVVEEVPQEEVKEEPIEEIVEEVSQEEVKEEPIEEIVEEVPQEEVKEEPTEEFVKEISQEEIKDIQTSQVKEQREVKQVKLPEGKRIEISTRGIAYEVPDDATKEFPSIREIMKRPLIERPVEVQKAVVQPGYTVDGIPTSMADMLSQEYDGQISLVMEEGRKIEKQITGQMNIEEVLIEWEKTKKQYEEKRTAERTQKVLEQTGSMFTEFEARIRDGILEQLQKEEQLAEENLLKREKSINERKGSSLEDTSGFDLEAVMLAEMAEEEAQRLAMENQENSQQLTVETEEAENLVMEAEEEPKTSTMEAKEESKEFTMEKQDEEDAIEQPTASKEEVQETLRKIRQAQEGIRELSDEEKALFAPFIQTKGARRRFMQALDLISLAAYTGNVIVTGEADSDTVKLAKNIMKDIQMTDSNFSGVIAKVSGASLNSKSIEGTVAKLNNGGLIIEKASGMNSQAVMKLLKALNQEQTGIVVILEDNKKAMKRMLAAYPSMSTFFNARIEVEELNNDALAAYGRQYAAHKEYAIDDLGMLALQTLIEDRQTSDHLVTVAEVRELVDDAIYSANRKTLSHFFDIIFGRRYDDEDMIILRERDFI